MRTADFDFDLPEELIAQEPAPQRDASRLLVLQRDRGTIDHRSFRDLPEYLRPGDVLVLNDTRVLTARLRARNTQTGGQFEVLLLSENAPNDWWAMLRPGKRARLGTRLRLHDLSGRPSAIEAVVVDTNAEGHRRLHFSGNHDIVKALETLGEVPLPPYIKRQKCSPDASGPTDPPPPAVDPNPTQTETTQTAPHARPALERLDRERYQTVYAGPPGSVAAPTAGLHFTHELLDRLQAAGVKVCRLTLHVGLGTFAPVKAERVADHVMHEERYELSEESARVINATRRGPRPGRVLAVGTTSLRVLESVAAGHGGRLEPGAGLTNIFIYPPFEFKVTDALLTNFHLPRSTLLMLVSAFASPGRLEGRELIRRAYAEAIRQRYRFFSYGDAMLIL